MEPKKTDLRVIRTRKAIRDAFCAMIMEMDYQDITIKELTQRAMINRNTFYLHYDSLDALLRELQDEIAGEFIEKQVSYTKMADIRRMIRVFFEYMATQSPLHDRLLCSGSYQFLYDRIQGKGDAEQIFPAGRGVFPLFPVAHPPDGRLGIVPRLGHGPDHPIPQIASGIVSPQHLPETPEMNGSA